MMVFSFEYDRILSLVSNITLIFILSKTNNFAFQPMADLTALRALLGAPFPYVQHSVGAVS